MYFLRVYCTYLVIYWVTCMPVLTGYGPVWDSEIPCSYVYGITGCSVDRNVRETISFQLSVCINILPDNL